MFNITEKEGYDAPRFLAEDLKNLSLPLKAVNASYGKNSMNISDLNSSFFEMYIIPAEDRHLSDHFPLYKLNFTWEIVYFRYNFMKI